ncbi:DUF2917 domain-containing protein [Paraburkholderia sp. Ac-20340]|uniref:DUF2917 domain-containing protein n=1 Tax=Paraburkholderia sp. Ac-20340 TaxID=2703888 RepID=UPI00197E62AF|nr:DUF2917 domain-containing protein [Paraburkholderia sp. Ac-20340]MBN3855523.1 DUF2917 domain-containing protein [Paraburkholderia sp. Ac-20340]
MERLTRADEAKVERLDVARRACRLVRRAQGGVIGVLEGRVLMTVEGDAQDYWLEPGEALPFAPGERVWIGGWDEAVSCEVSVPMAPELAWLRWCQRLAASVLRRPARARLRVQRG